jgi:hypothetical protein
MLTPSPKIPSLGERDDAVNLGRFECALLEYGGQLLITEAARLDQARIGHGDGPDAEGPSVSFNRIKSTLARLGIRNFKPTQRNAADRLASVHTPEGMPLPPNTLAELQRDMARLGFVVSQIREIEDARQKRLEQHPETGPHAMVRLLARIVGVGVETADMLVLRCYHGQCVTAEQWRATPA